MASTPVNTNRLWRTQVTVVSKPTTTTTPVQVFNRIKAQQSAGAVQSSPVTEEVQTQPTATTTPAAQGGIGGGGGGGRGDTIERAPITTEQGLKEAIGFVSMDNQLNKLFKTETRSVYEPYVPYTTATGLKGTAGYRTPYPSEQTPEQRYEYTTTQEQTKAFISTGFKADVLRSQYQERVNTGELTVEKATQLMKEDYATAIQSDISKFNVATQGAYNLYVKQSTLRSLIPTATKSFIYGGAIALVPALIYPVGAIGVTSLYLNRKEMVEQFRIAPIESVGVVGAGVAGGLAGGYLTSKFVVQPIKQYQFNRAFSKEQFNLIGTRQQLGKNLYKTEAYSIGENVVKGTNIKIKVEQLSKYSNENIMLPSSTRLTYSLEKGGVTSISTYEGITSQFPGVKGASIFSKGVQISGEGFQGFIGKSNMALVSTVTKYPAAYSFPFLKRTEGKIVTKTFEESPFIKTGFGGVVKTEQLKGSGFNIISSKGGKVLGGKVFNFGGGEIGISQVQTQSNININLFEQIPTQIGKSNIVTPAKITRTPLSKTFSTQITTQTTKLSFVGLSAPALATPSLKPVAATGLVTGILSVPKVSTSQRSLLSLQQPQALKDTTQMRQPNIVITTPMNIGAVRGATVPALTTLTLQQTGLKSALISPLVSISRADLKGFSFPSLNFPGPLPFIFPPTGSFEFGMGRRKIKSKKQRKKYTPSFDALIKGIKGKAPAKLTGIETRPITKGFKWTFGRIKL